MDRVRQKFVLENLDSVLHCSILALNSRFNKTGVTENNYTGRSRQPEES